MFEIKNLLQVDQSLTFCVQRGRCST